jgi:hypothetical protein
MSDVIEEVLSYLFPWKAINDYLQVEKLYRRNLVSWVLYW